MNGPLLVLRQTESGVRPMVTNLDNLRLKYGNDNVKIVTPKAETRIRCGDIAHIPISVEVSVLNNKYPLILNITKGEDDDGVNIEAIIPTKEGDNIELMTGIQADISHFLDAESSSPFVDKNELAVAIVERFRHLVEERLENDSEEPTGDDEDQVQDQEQEEQLQQIADENLGGGEQTIENEDREAKCFRCRKVLFTQREVTAHEQNTKVGGGGGGASQGPCSSVFLLEPPMWLLESSSTSSSQGKVVCPKCQSRLGNWDWSGSVCSCGSWVTPAFQFTKSKLDF